MIDHNNDIKDKMKSVEMNQSENKKVWMAPELEILDGRKTLGGESDYPEENLEFGIDGLS